MKIFHGFNTNSIRGDFFGGLTAAVVALPLALAFGVASGLGPLPGLYGAIIVGFFAALFGGTPTQITGPTGPMTVVVASIFLYALLVAIKAKTEVLIREQNSRWVQEEVTGVVS